MALLKTTVVGLLSGFIAGFLVTGIGGRIVMRLIAVVDPYTQPKFTSDTLFLVIFFALLAGAIFGAPGGLLFIATRRWLPGNHYWKGVIFGLILLLVSGGFFFSLDHEEDFFLFDPPLFGISLFAALYIVYGFMVGVITEQFVRYVPAPLPRRQTLIATYIILALLCLFGILQNIQAIGAILRAAG
jgi:hypothetical protein